MAGIAGADTVSVGGWTIQEQPVQLADNMAAVFIQSSGDGVLGLGFGKDTVVRTPVQNMLSSDQNIPKSEQVFAVNLCSSSSSSAGGPFFVFGSTSAKNTEIHYTLVNRDRGFWEFDSSSATVNGKILDLPGNRAVADTGTPLVLLDDTICQAIYDGIPGATYDYASQGYVFPADVTTGMLPSVTLAVGERRFAVKKEELSFASVQDKPGYVYGGIQSRGSLEFDVLGGTFLKGVYAVSSNSISYMGLKFAVTDVDLVGF